jgi:hypothetical protein
MRWCANVSLMMKQLHGDLTDRWNQAYTCSASDHEQSRQFWFSRSQGWLSEIEAETKGERWVFCLAEYVQMESR